MRPWHVAPSGAVGLFIWVLESKLAVERYKEEFEATLRSLPPTLRQAGHDVEVRKRLLRGDVPPIASCFTPKWPSQWAWYQEQEQRKQPAELSPITVPTPPPWWVKGRTAVVRYNSWRLQYFAGLVDSYDPDACEDVQVDELLPRIASVVGDPIVGEYLRDLSNPRYAPAMRAKYADEFDRDRCSLTAQLVAINRQDV